MSAMSVVEINRLLNIQTHLEKSINSLLRNLKNFQNLEEIAESAKTLQNSRETEQCCIQNAIDGILRSLKSKKDWLSQKKIHESTDLNVFKNDMIALQNDIQSFKAQIRLKLSHINLDLDSLEEDAHLYSSIEKWSKTVKIKEYHSASTYKQNTMFIKHRVKEVQEFMDFLLKSNGHENGWRKEDHQIFIKFCKKYRDIDQLATNLNELLPDISIQEIKNHKKWYDEYLVLKERKKKAILNWKKSKKNRNPINTSSDDSAGVKIIAGGAHPDTIKETLQKWKAEKEEQILRERLLEEQQEIKQKELEDLRKKRNEEMKKLVHEWKTTKSEIQQQELFRQKTIEEREKKQRATEANKLLKQFRSHDDMYIMKIREYKNRKKAEVPIRSKSSNIASRDPERLFKPTKQWINRVHDDSVYDSTFSSTWQVLNLPKLGVPEWRKAMENK